MKKYVLLFASIMLYFLVFSCKSTKYIKEIPYKILFNQKEIENYLGINDRLLPILDTLNQEYENNLTERQIYLKEKYSIVLNIKPEELRKYNFYDFIDKSIGTNYFNAYSVENSTMALFVSDLYKYAFKEELPKTPIGIFKSENITLFTGRKFLQEGDLIFFRYNKDVPVGNVAVYLRNNRILTAVADNGLIISDFNLDYFQLRYICAGRLNLTEDTTLNDNNDSGKD